MCTLQEPTLTMMTRGSDNDSGVPLITIISVDNADVYKHTASPGRTLAWHIIT